MPPFDTKGRWAMSNRMALTSMGGIAGEMMAHGFNVVSRVYALRSEGTRSLHLDVGKCMLCAELSILELSGIFRCF